MAEKHYMEQKRHAEQHLIPYLEDRCPGFSRFRVLEIGCAEGGFLSALREKGMRAVGLELSPGRAALALSLDPGLDVRVGDAAAPSACGRPGGPFDLVVMRDVIEHVPDRPGLFRNMRLFLKKGGYAYITFPPRFSPFAGHHQNGRSVLKHVPYLHMLPAPLLRFLGGMMKEHPHIIEGAVANFKTGLSVAGFERCCRKHGFDFINKDFFLIRPVYQVRFGIRPVRIPDIPFIRETIATGCECLVKKSEV